MAGTDKRKQSLYFPEDMLREIQEEANRQDRSLSWIVQQAWKIALGQRRDRDWRSLRPGARVVSANDARKQSLYFPDEMLNEIQTQAQRLDRSLSWVVQQAWKISKTELRKIPSPNDMLDEDPNAQRR